MTIDEAIALVKIERECVIRADVCDRKCEKCDLLQDSTELTDMYEHLAEWLEELKAYKENQHRSLRHMYEKGYNKAIDDFAILMKETLNLAEQLKAGGENERSI